MATISDGSNATISVGQDDIITVQCPNGWVRYEYPVGTTVVEFTGTRSFGPFANAGSVRLTSVQRSVYYEVSDLTASPASSGKMRPYTGLVATRGKVLNSTNVAYQQLQGKTRHVAMDNITSLQLVYGGWYTTNPRSNGNVSEVNASAASTITASIEYPMGTRTQVKFSGSATGTIPVGSNLVSDSVAVSIPLGAAFFVHVFQQNPTSVLFIGSVTSAGTGELCNLAASGLTDLTMAGTITNTFFTTHYPPLAIIGNTSRPSFALFGDSKCEGALDTYSDAYLLLGELERAAGKSFGFTNCGLGGERMSDVAGGTATKRVALAQYASHVLSQYGINDITNSRTAGQVLTDLATFRALFPGKPFYQGTVAPVTTSSDSWATTGNQTTHANNAARVTLNQSIRNHNTGALDGHMEIADAVESGRDSGIWKAAYTTDGTHETQTAYIAVKTFGGVDDALALLK